MSGPNQSLVLPFADFIPKARLLVYVTRALNPIVTTLEEHGYSVGWRVTLLVPPVYGMHLNYADCAILEILTPFAFRVDLDTSQEDLFVAPTFPPPFTPAQVIPQSGETINNLTPIPLSLA